MIEFNHEGYRRHLASLPKRAFRYESVLEGGEKEELWRERFRAGLRERLGMHRMTADAVPLRPRLAGTRSFAEYTEEKWYLTTEPGIELPFYLLLPSRPGRSPLVLTPHGHNRRGKEVYVGHEETEAEAEEAARLHRDIARQAVLQGYAAIAPDVRGFWEMARDEDRSADAPYPNSCRELQRIAMLYGRTLIGERVHDIGRLIDFASSREEIDASRVIITGNSGGGTVSLFAAALDDRVAMVIPGSYFSTFEASLVPIRHCPCNIIPGILELGEMYDIAALVAPRPMLIVHGEQDDIYPIEATKEAFTHLKRVYTELGVPERCELYVGSGGHRYYKDRVWSFVQEQWTQMGY